MPAVAALLGRNGAGAKASEAHAEPGFLLVPHPYRTRKCVKRNSGWGVWGERPRLRIALFQAHDHSSVLK